MDMNRDKFETYILDKMQECRKNFYIPYDKCDNPTTYEDIKDVEARTKYNTYKEILTNLWNGTFNI